MNAVVDIFDVQFRPMREVDLDAVVNIEKLAYPFPWSRGIFSDCLRAGYSCWVMTEGVEVAGYGILSAAAGEAHVLNLCVAPERQGRGLGRRLLDRLIDVARWHQSESVFLEVRPTNLSAIAMYHGRGFKEVGRRPNYYPAEENREDAIVMALRLRSAET